MKQLVFLSLIFFALSLKAEKFSNKYIEFEIPPGFSCRLDSTEWVCQPRDANRTKDAIIVFAAKIRGSQDDIHSYEEHLKKPRFFKSPNGKEMESKVNFVKMKNLNGQDWVDSLHLSSELPDFYTRYLATTKNDLGILYTFSVRRDKYEEYSRDIAGTIVSIRVFRQPGTLDSSVHSGSGESILGPPPELEVDPVVTTDIPESAVKPKTAKKPQSSQQTAEYLLYVLLAVGVGGYIIWRRKKS